MYFRNALLTFVFFCCRYKSIDSPRNTLQCHMVDPDVIVCCNPLNIHHNQNVHAELAVTSTSLFQFRSIGLYRLLYDPFDFTFIKEVYVYLHWSNTNKNFVDQLLSVYKWTAAILNRGTFVCDKTCGRTGPSYHATIWSIYFEHKVYKNYIISEVVISLCFEELA